MDYQMNYQIFKHMHRPVIRFVCIHLNISSLINAISIMYIVNASYFVDKYNSMWR